MGVKKVPYIIKDMKNLQLIKFKIFLRVEGKLYYGV